ncbi:MAG: TVP38/TMEM64 family protein [Clostridia bacterium]|nr:TVP38/TMEM64 family protein [Clostridia bacterium]
MDKKTLKKAAGITVSLLFAVVTAIFTVVLVRGVNAAFLIKYGKITEWIAVSLIVAIASLTVFFAVIGKDFYYKTGLVCLSFLFFSAGILFVLYATGLLDRVDSIEDFREFIASYGELSVTLFLVMQILQVVALPIPGVVAIGAGVLLFGPFWGAVLSLIGIVIGSLAAFFIGRVFGYKVVKWIVGEENLQKGLELVKGKDKVVLTFMFLFPFFPDDILCFVSGLSSMSARFFTVMVVIARLISTFATAYSVNGSLIPYDTWWGLLIWAVLIAGALVLAKIVYSNSEKIEKFFNGRKK